MSEQRALSVTEAMTLAKRTLEGVRVTVVGEVSEFNDKPGYKAAYFTVCDGDASMPCLMWRDAYVASGIPLRCGMLVELSGQFSAYVPKGRMQFSVKRLQLAGEGRLRMQVAELARRLELEGLTSPQRKKPIPRLPEVIGVVTSPRGKAVHDVIRTLKRRYPMAEVRLAGVQVEGEGAVDQIVEGLEVADAAGCDVILLVRGGGSYEDLMPFNSERVARAVASMRTPVITGIGHEPDRSVADMVADLSASTPTAAAESAAPSIDELGSTLGREQVRLGRALQHLVAGYVHRLSRVAHRPAFSDPRSILAAPLQAIDVARMRLERAIPARLERDAHRLDVAAGRFARLAPQLTQSWGNRVAMGAARLDDLSPLKILARGYSATFLDDGRTVVRSVEQVDAGDAIRVRVSDGTLSCSVTGASKGEAR